MDTQSTSPDNPPLRRSASLDPMLELSGARKRKSFLPSRRGKTNRQVNSKACQKNIITLPASNEVITSENSRFVEYPPPLSINIRKDPLVSVKKRLLINACCKFSLNIQKLPVQLLKPYNITGQQDVGGAKPSGRGLGMTLVDEGRCLSRSSSLSYEVPLQNETDSQQCDDDTVAETPLKSPPIVSNKDALAGLLPSKRNIMANRKRRQDTGIERSPKKMKSTEGREAIKTRNNAAKNRITVSDTIDHAVKADNCEPVVEKPRQKTTSSRQKTTSSRQQCPPDKKKLKKEDHPNIILIKDTSPSIKGSVDDNKPIKRVRRTRVTMKKSTTSTRRGMSLRRGRGVCSLTDNKTQTLTTTESSHSNDSDNSDDFLILNTKRRPEPSPKKRRYDTDTSSDESLSLKVSLELKHPKATVMLKRSHPASKAPTIEQPPAQGMSWTSFQNEIEAAKTRQRSENQSSVPPPSSPSPSPQLRSSKQRQTVHSSRVSTVQPLLETERDNNQNKKPTLVKVKSNSSKKPPIVPKGRLKRTIDSFLSETSTVDRSSPEPQDTAPLGRRNTKSKFLMTSSEPDDNPQSLYNSKEETSQVIRVSDNEIHQKDPAPVKTKSRKNKAKITKAITRSRKQLDDTTTPVSPFTHPNTTRSPTKRSSTLPTNSLPSPIVKTSPLRSRKRTSSHTSSSVTTSISSSKPFNGDSPGSSRVAGAGSRTNKLPPAFTGPGKYSKCTVYIAKTLTHAVTCVFTNMYTLSH